MNIIKPDKSYTRSSVERNRNYMYIFTDNTDRDSGSSLIDPDSWYCKKYGKNKHYPSMTSAVIRGLYNAFPITTQRYYNDKYKGVRGRWHDEDIEEFKKIIDDDFNNIYRNIYKFEYIVIPDIFDSKISKLNKERTPLLYKYLCNKIEELYKYIKSTELF